MRAGETLFDVLDTELGKDGSVFEHRFDAPEALRLRPHRGIQNEIGASLSVPFISWPSSTDFLLPVLLIFGAVAAAATKILSSSDGERPLVLLRLRA